jgi:hypothetical protein
MQIKQKWKEIIHGPMFYKELGWETGLQLSGSVCLSCTKPWVGFTTLEKKRRGLQYVFLSIDSCVSLIFLLHCQRFFHLCHHQFLRTQIKRKILVNLWLWWVTLCLGILNIQRYFAQPFREYSYPLHTVLLVYFQVYLTHYNF